ncbi:MAG: hypothetical protein LAN71_15890 [Acidobacteriia bacterium]|nr:hypothetical protein [Terriglobia bacterium]
MISSAFTLPCDGCGRSAPAAHIAGRLQRLEWATRFRPVHIGVLFLGLAAPARDEDYLYAGAGEEGQSLTGFAGEARHILHAAGLDALAGGKYATRAKVLEEFQHRGYFLAHLLECPPEAPGREGSGLLAAATSHMPAVLTRIRRSLKPKQIALVSSAMQSMLAHFTDDALGAPLLLDGGKPFALDGPDPAAAAERLRVALEGKRGPGR